MNDTFSDLWLNHLPFETKEDLYEQLYLQAIIESYNYIDKSTGDENSIRDRFYWDLINRNPLTKNHVDNNLLKISFEDWIMVSEEEKRRVDLSFFISYFGSFEVECKCFSDKQTENGQYLGNGLIRFIDMRYAEKDDYAGMIGFVVGGDTKSILKSNIENTAKFHPTNPAKPTRRLKGSFWTSEFISFHEKRNGKDIQVYHLLFEFHSKDNEK